MNAVYDLQHLFIGVDWIAANQCETAPVVNPATQRELSRVPQPPISIMRSLSHGSEGGVEGIEYYLAHKFISHA